VCVCVYIYIYIYIYIYTYTHTVYDIYNLQMRPWPAKRNLAARGLGTRDVHARG